MSLVLLQKLPQLSYKKYCKSAAYPHTKLFYKNCRLWILFCGVSTVSLFSVFIFFFFSGMKNNLPAYVYPAQTGLGKKIIISAKMSGF